MAFIISALKLPAEPNLFHKLCFAVPSAFSVFYWFLSRMRLRIRLQSAILNPGYKIPFVKSFEFRRALRTYLSCFFPIFYLRQNFPLHLGVRQDQFRSIVRHQFLFPKEDNMPFNLSSFFYHLDFTELLFLQFLYFLFHYII